MTPIRFKFMTPEGEPLANTAFEIELPCPGYHPDPAGVVLPRMIEAMTDGNGEALIELWPLPNHYQVLAWDPEAKSELFYKFIVPVLPEGATELRLQDIIINGTLISQATDPDILAEMIAVRTQTLALRDATAVIKGQVEALLPIISETAPVDPQPGWEWVDPTTGKSYVWWVDEDSGQWVERATVAFVSYTPLGVYAENVLSDALPGDIPASDVQAQLTTLAVAVIAAAEAIINSDRLGDNAVILSKLVDGILTADADGRAKMADGFITAVQVATNALNGSSLALELDLSGNTLMAYKEKVATITGTTPALSPNNGPIQTWSLTANSTPTVGTWAEGQGMTLMIDDGSARTINWGTVAVNWKTDGGVAPELNLTGFTFVHLWKVGATIYGARIGDA